MVQQTLPQTRWQEIEKIWKDNRWLYILAGILMGIISVPAIEQITGDLNTLIGNLVPETIGIIFTVLILNRAADNRAQDELKHQLLADLKSTSVTPAVNALDRLRREGWLTEDYFTTGEGRNLQRANWEGAYIGGLNFAKADMRSINLKNVTNHDGSQNQPVCLKNANLIGAHLERANLTGAHLQGADLEDAHLQGADLSEAHLERAYLEDAHLQGALLNWAYLERANLTGAHLEGANLYRAHLEGADLWAAHLERAKLEKAHLQGADLTGAHLQGADLTGAHLQGADLKEAHLENVRWGYKHFENSAILPDGTVWTPEEDKRMERFTNPEHPKYEATLEKINAIRIELGYDPIGYLHVVTSLYEG